jgi:glycosyltransferase involved in cell wall biosynthesis
VNLAWRLPGIDRLPALLRALRSAHGTGALRDLGDQAAMLAGYTAGLAAGRLAAVLPGRRAASAAARARSVLLMAYHAPPFKPMWGTQRSATFAKYLARAGWDVTLLAAAPADPRDRIDGPEPELDGVHVVRLPERPLSSLGWRGVVAPDSYARWVLPAAQSAWRLVRERDIGLVVASAPPYSTLLAGTLCAAWTGRPLIADFRDPWSHIDTGWVLAPGAPRAITRALERSVLRRVEAAIMVDPLRYADEYFVDAGLLRELVSIPNGFDEEDFEGLAAPAPAPGAAFTMSYVGTLYDEATCAAIVRPLQRWQAQAPDDMRQVVLEYAGQSGALFDRLGFRPPFLRDRGYLSHPQALAVRAASTVQLLVQPASFKPHVSSGKIYEMLRAGVPILAVTREDGAVAELIRRTGAGVVVGHDHAAIARAMRTLFARWQAGGLGRGADPARVIDYSRERLAGRLADLLGEVAARS